MASIDKVKIGNMALSHCGISTTIESFTEQSVEATQINLWYDFARRQALAALDWNFARKRLTLATHSDDAPSNEWAFRYQYPVDAIVLRRLENPNGTTADAVPYIVENSEAGDEKTILTNMEDAIAVYTFDNTDPNMYSEIFVNALSLLVAAYIVMPLTSKRQYKSDILSQYVVTLRLAQATNTNEKVEAAPRDTDWIRERD